MSPRAAVAVVLGALAFGYAMYRLAHRHEQCVKWEMHSPEVVNGHPLGSGAECVEWRSP